MQKLQGGLLCASHACFQRARGIRCVHMCMANEPIPQSSSTTHKILHAQAKPGTPWHI